MASVTQVDMPCGSGAILRVSLLPRSTDSDALLDLKADPDRDQSMEPVQLKESTEYRYEFIIPGAPPGAVITTDPGELFEPDTPDGRTGRLRPRLHTGTLPVTIYVDQQSVGRVAFEVRSRKLDYLNHYRWMLRDIADSLSEAVMERFAPTEQRFALEEGRDAATLYQRFAFLKSLLQSEAFDAAVQQILARPHRAWVEREEWRTPGQGLPAGAGAARQLSRPGKRIAWEGGTLPSIPAQVQVHRTVETLDTPENRFVQFALSHWRELVADVERALAAEGQSGPVQRGRREAALLLEQLDSYLSADIFREVGPMSLLPAASQVLQKRAGYRDLFRAFLQAEVAALLTWEGGEDVYSAGQRNVAALYEYWIFLQMARLVAARCQPDFDQSDLFEIRPDGLGVGLKRGRQRLVSGTVIRHGRRLRVELWFNRSFDAGAGSWTKRMRPDCSLRIQPHPAEGARFEPIWLHFDAKYRIDHYQELFRDDADTEGEEGGTAKRDDLLKMHAYRDAILRSEGAYVLYPGTEREGFQQFHEILPGLGAFALRPTEDRDAEGADLLGQFLDDVLDHVASQGSQRERWRYWGRVSYGPESRAERPVPAVTFLTRPPADTPVLLGYVKSEAHLAWIHGNRLYNLRADGRRGGLSPGAAELAAELLVLYGPSVELPEIWRIRGGPELITRTGMLELGYPEPGGEYYHGLLLEPVEQKSWPMRLTSERVQALLQARMPVGPVGAPIAVTWLDMVR